MKHKFLFKLIPPRPSFAQDMTDNERQVMMHHVEHWKQLMEKGTAVAFGPVLDPNGSWGVAIVEVDNESEIKTLVDSDPVTKAGLGRIETYPMSPATIVRK